MPNEQVKHLELIQAVINRMAANSALFKGWSITLAAALIGLAAGKDAKLQYALLGIAPPIFFAVLDAFYLRQERLFRKLYDLVRKMSAADWGKDPFSMDTSVVTGVHSWFRTIFAKVVILPHGLVLLIVVGIVIVWHCVLGTSCPAVPIAK
jgi:hypothetical protein